MIQQFVDVAKKAGLAIDGIDLQAFALARSLSETTSFVDEGAPAQPDAATALVNIGAGITNLVVAVGGLPQFTRVVNLGCESLTQTLLTNRGIERDEAEALRVSVGLTGEGPDDVPGLEAETIAEIHHVLDGATEAFSDEIRRSIDYYHTQEHEGAISKLLLTGSGSLTRNICHHLSQALHLPVEIGNALKEVGENKSKLSQAELESMAPRLAIAIGLALEGEE
jgi:type IV pilus assembly protein PilM